MQGKPTLATWQKPHTFAEALEFINKVNDIDYEVKIAGHQGALMSRTVWLDAVREGFFRDYDGFGDQINWNGEILNRDGDWLRPSNAKNIKPETAYILWYNR